jgi:hypothetical protein
MIEKTIGMSEVAIKDNHRCQWDKTGSREEPSWLPPPPRRWLNPIHIGGVGIVRVGIDRLRWRNRLGLNRLLRGRRLRSILLFSGLVGVGKFGVFFEELTNRR